MSAPLPPLARAFREHLLRRGRLRAGDALVVGVSGGRDSVVLLHLLRFTPGLPELALTAAHVDHGMRPGSDADGRWVRGVAAAWGIPLRATRLEPPPANEAEARRRRYAFLDQVRRDVGGAAVLTAHHADDQAETVLFRALRGTGLGGLQGIRARRARRVWRPLLPFTRDELEAYAAAAGLSWREDPTNALPLARNVLRREVLPRLEATVAPGARRALASLARRARADDAAWRSLEPGLLEAAGIRTERDGVSVDRGAFLELHGGVRARLLRSLARRVGATPGEAGTRAAVEFTSSGASGGSVPLGEGVELRRELGRLHVVRPEAAVPDSGVGIAEPGEGVGRAVVGGATFQVRWGGVSRGEGPGAVTLGCAGVRFPLEVRGWRPGDRMRLPYGSKKLKKLFLEAGVPPGERHRTPVLTDAEGNVLWVPGVARSTDAVPGDGDRVLHIRITHGESD